MNSRFLIVMLGTLALIFATHTSSAQAGWFRSLRRAPSHCTVTRVPAGTHQMVLRNNGKSLWDLGQNMGQWPTR